MWLCPAPGWSRDASNTREVPGILHWQKKPWLPRHQLPTHPGSPHLPVNVRPSACRLAASGLPCSLAAHLEHLLVLILLLHELLPRPVVLLRVCAGQPSSSRLHPLWAGALTAREEAISAAQW